MIGASIFVTYVVLKARQAASVRGAQKEDADEMSRRMNTLFYNF